jgi:hypothetical protein
LVSIVIIKCFVSFTAKQVLNKFFYHIFKVSVRHKKSINNKICSKSELIVIEKS